MPKCYNCEVHDITTIVALWSSFMHGPPFILFIGEARQILNYNRQFEVMPGSGTDRCTGCGGVEDSFNSSIDIEAKLKLHAM